MRALGFKLAWFGAVAATATSIGLSSVALAGPSGGSGAAGDVDPKSITSIPLECKDDGPVVLGHLHCNDLITQVLALNRKHLAYFSWNYYHGKQVDQATGVVNPIPKPVCNLSAGEEETNQFGDSCGQFCEFNVHTIPPGADPKGLPPQYCVRELSWSEGALIQALNFYKEKVYAQFKSKTVTLADFDGSRPCGEQAADLLNLMHHRDASEKALIDQRNAYNNSAEMTCKSSDGTGADQASCMLEMANKQLVTLWDLLLVCEIASSAVKDNYNRVQNKDALMNDAKNFAIGCILEAAACLLCPDSVKSDIVNGCYKKKVPGYLKSKFNSFWPTSEPLEKPAEPGSSQSRSAPESAPGASLMAIASLGSFLRKKKRFLTITGTFTGVVFFLSVMSFIVPAAGKSTNCGCMNGSCACNGCAGCDGCSACMGCADCPYILNSDLSCLGSITSASGGADGAAGSTGNVSGISNDDDPSTYTPNGPQCSNIHKAMNQCPPSSGESDKVKNCVQQYCPGGASGSSSATQQSGQQSGPQTTPSSAMAPPAAPVASATQGNLDGVDKTTGNKGGVNDKGGGAATAGEKSATGPAPGAHESGTGGGGGGGAPPMAGGTNGGPGAGTTTGSNGQGASVNLGGGPDTGGGAADGASGGSGVLGGGSAFDSAGSGGGGGRGGSKGGGDSNPLAGLFGSGGGGGAQGNTAPGNVNFDNANSNGSGKDDEDTLKNSAGKSLFEIVNKRMDRWGSQGK